MSKRIWSVSLAAVLGASLVPGGVLTGTVKGDGGAALSGAKVAVFGKTLSATTDAGGKFRITSDELLDGNKYSVTVTADGYDVAQTISVEMYDDPADMEPIEIEMLKTEVIVVDTNAPAMQMPRGMTTNAPPVVESANETEDTNTVETSTTDLIDVTEPATGTNAAPAR